MDERSHHQHSMPTAQDGRGFGQQQDRPSPWPGAAPSAPHGAPIVGALPHYQPAASPHGHGQHHGHQGQQAWQAQPGMPGHLQADSPAGGQGVGAQPSAQYAYAPGFVMPGAASGQAPPMSAHGHTIGAPQPAAGAPLHHGFAQAPAWQPGATAAVAAHEPPQAWAYQTPQGLQLVQPGAAAYAQQPQAIGAGVGARRRVRWETIVPAAAVTCLVAAIGLFISDFDRMTGRDGSSSEPAAARAAEPTGAAATNAAAAPSTGDTTEIVAQAQGFFERGRFEDAANLLHPLLDAASPDPDAVALHDRVDAASTRNRALLGRLARERSAGRWTAVVSTIGELESLRPLSKDLVALRGTARRSARTQAIVTRARSLMAKRRDAEALAIVERGLANGRNRKLEALREQLSARMAAPATPRSNAGGSRPAPPRPGGAAARPSAPAQPPANVPQGAIPTRPDLPNPTGGGASVAPAVAGGGGTSGANCHEHDGVRECH